MRFQVIDDLKIYNKSCPVYLQSHILDIFQLNKPRDDRRKARYTSEMFLLKMGIRHARPKRG